MIRPRRFVRDYSYTSQLEIERLTKRPDYGPEQIRAPGGLEVGKVYEKMSDICSTGRVEIMEPAKGRQIKVKAILDNGSKVFAELSLDDAGVMPYSDGTWNLVNWMREAKK